MKKILSVTLALIMMLSCLCFNAFAAGTKTEALFSKLNTAREVSITLKAGDVNLFGVLPLSATDTVYIKGDKVAYEYSLSLLTARVVYDGAKVFGYLPNLPFFYVQMDGSAIGKPDVWGLIESASNVTLGVLAYQKSYNENYNGVDYYVEEFNDRAQVTSKFYYVGDSLKMLKVEDAQNGSVQYTYFENISFSVDDSVFAFPEGAFDLSVILLSLFSSLITTL